MAYFTSACFVLLPISFLYVAMQMESTMRDSLGSELHDPRLRHFWHYAVLVVLINQ